MFYFYVDSPALPGENYALNHKCMKSKKDLEIVNRTTISDLGTWVLFMEWRIFFCGNYSW